MAHRTPPPPLSAEATALVAEAPVFDAHVDSLQRMLDLGQDLGVRGPGHLDLVRGREGGLGSVVLVCWVDPSYLPDGCFDRAAALLETAHGLARRHPDRIALVRDGEELAGARRDGLVAGIPGIEGGHAIESSLDKLAWFHGRGLRMMTLVWNNHLPWIRSCQEGAGPGIPAGLSDFGRDVVRSMNELGMVVDLSHAGVRSFYDALEASERPVVASHSGCAALHAHPRNLDDDQLRALALHGGVVGIVFHPGFLDADARAEETRVRNTKAYTGIQAQDETERFLRQCEVMERDAAPLPAERLVDHVLHAVEVAGIEHVGIGSDFDGIQRGPEWLGNASCYGVLAELLLRRGLTVDETRLVLGANMERVFAEVTA